MENNFAGDLEFKKIFITKIEEELNDDALDRYIKLFEKARRQERYLKKDLYDFNTAEVKLLLGLYRTTDIYTLINMSNYIFKYKLYAYNHKYTTIIPSKLNEEDLKKCLDMLKINNKYLTYEEYLQLLDNIVNAQDKAIIVLCWVGIVGKELRDLLGLKITDIDFINNEINFIDCENNERFIKLEEFETKILKEAINQDLYQVVKLDEDNMIVGNAVLTEEEREKELEKKELKGWGTIYPNQYVLRKIGKYEDVDLQEGNPFSYAGLRNRFYAVKKMSLESAISFKSIYDSGIVYRILRGKIDYTKSRILKEYIEKEKLVTTAYSLQKVIDIMLEKLKDQ